MVDSEDLNEGGDEGWLDQLREETELHEGGPPGFVLEDLLGRGGMAEVYLAHRTGPMGFSRKVVVKCIRPDILGESLSVERFIREASLAAQLHHPNIVEVIDLITQNDMYYIVMEYLHGMHLGKIAQKLNKMRVRCPPGVVGFVGKGVASALSYAHNFTGRDGKVHRLVHRDISPENVMVTYAGHAKLVDFGVAKDLDALNSLTQGDQVIGKPLYLPPEALDGSKATPARDIYSLGITLWVALSGRPPFATDGGPEGLAKLMNAILHEEIPTFQSVGIEVPEELETIVRGALNKDPDKRPTAEQIQQQLDNFIEHERVTSDTVANMMNRMMGDKRPVGSKPPKTGAPKSKPVIRQETPPTGFMRSPHKVTAVGNDATAQTIAADPIGPNSPGTANAAVGDMPTMISEQVPFPTQKVLIGVGVFMLLCALVALIAIVASSGGDDPQLDIDAIHRGAEALPPPQPKPTPQKKPSAPTRSPQPAAKPRLRPAAGGMMGTLIVKCTYYSDVEVDGRPVGKCDGGTDFQVRLPVGQHEVSADDQYSPAKLKTVHITRGVTELDFRPPKKKRKDVTWSVPVPE